MANPQPENGFVRVANELWDEIICRSFSKRQIDILLFILRLSYGCNKKTAKIPRQQDFILAGLGGKGNIALELKRLEVARVITRNKEAGEYALNKDYETWDVGLVKGWEKARFEKLLNLNLEQGKKQRKPKAGRAPKSSQNENSQMGEEFSKQEPKVSGEVLKLRTEENGEVLKTRTDDENEFLKREPEVLEIRTETPSQPLQDAASQPPKDIKDINILKTYKDIVSDVVLYLNQKTGKNYKPGNKETIKNINGRIEEGATLEDFKHVIDVKVAEWGNDPYWNKFLRPSTLFRPSKFENYLNQNPVSSLAVPQNGGNQKTRHDLNNESILKFAGGEYGSTEFGEDFIFNQSSLPELRDGPSEE
ncbi:conserved phage C-terminal domain-containing protein [Paenibacillus sp. RC84]|uniref:conserved phage C-terminal domain-containing protein n=1 Tax=Paenibacillus sp. RC84 TaxID=3156252 RepID=UPI00351253AF